MNPSDSSFDPDADERNHGSDSGRGRRTQPSAGTAESATHSTPGSLRRRGFLAALSATGLSALAGCTVSVNEDGITWGDGAGSGSPPTARPRTATPRNTRTSTPTQTATGTPTQTTTGTPTATATETPEQELEVMTAELEPVDAVLVTPEETPTATPEPVTARFGLRNFRLYVVKAGDGVFEGPGSLELIGSIEVRGYDDRGTEICPVDLCRIGGPFPTAWLTQYPNTVDVDEGERAKKLSTVTDPVFVDFPDFESMDSSRAYIEVSASFTDDDGASSMDDLGDGSVRWYLDGPQSGGPTSDGNGEAKFSLSVKGDDAHVRVSFDVDRFD